MVIARDGVAIGASLPSGWIIECRITAGQFNPDPLPVGVHLFSDDFWEAGGNPLPHFRAGRNDDNIPLVSDLYISAKSLALLNSLRAIPAAPTTAVEQERAQSKAPPAK